MGVSSTTAWCAGVSIMALLLAGPLAAQTAPVQTPDTKAAPVQPATPPQSEGELLELLDPPADEIVIVGTRDPNSVKSDIPADQTLDETTIAGYGASSVEDLLGALEPMTRSARGGGGRPIILVNGRRISSFREVHNLPPEAIKKVEIFPEEVAVAYGYRPDQRVVNFILKDNFRSVALEGKYGFATAGGRDSYDAEAGAFLLQKNGRFDLKAEYENKAPLYEAQRGLPAGYARTLLSKSEDFQLEGTAQRYLSKTVSGSLNASFESTIGTGAAGASDPRFTAPGTACPPNSALLCDGRIDTWNKTQTLHGGLTLNGDIDKWRWNIAANHDRNFTRSATDRRRLVDDTLLDTSYGRSISSDATATLSGPVADIKAGSIRTSFSAGFNRYDYFGRSDRATSERYNGPVTTDLGRTQGNVQASIDVPIASARDDVLAFLGRLSLNANAGYSRLSDFGSLFDWGTGLSWSPNERLSLSGSIAVDEMAPSVSQLGSPITITPQRTIYDFRNGTTVLADSISGGNPDLQAQSKREWKLSANYRPAFADGLWFNAEYNNRHIDHPISGLPLITEAVEAAFPGRVTRDANGAITRVDYRPVNFLSSDTQSLRFGVNFFKATKPKQADKTEGSATPRGGDGARGGGRGGMMMGGGGPMGGGGGGGWNVSLFDTITLIDRLKIAAGIPSLDLLNGSANGSNGGTPRHNLNLDAGWFGGGFGVRGSATYASATTAGTGDDRLRFGDLLTFNLRAFVNMNQQEEVVKAVPLLANTRFTVSLNNVTNAVQKVTNDAGVVPLSYQPGYLNPLGRYIEFGIRKTF